MEQQTVMETATWNEAVFEGNFVRLDQDKRKVLVLKDWKLQKVKKFDEEQVEFTAKVVEEDNKGVEGEKFFTTTSNRLKLKLRPLFENQPTDKEVRLAVTKFGEKYNTNYGVESL